MRSVSGSKPLPAFIHCGLEPSAFHGPLPPDSSPVAKADSLPPIRQPFRHDTDSSIPIPCPPRPWQLRGMGRGATHCPRLGIASTQIWRQMQRLPPIRSSAPIPIAMDCKGSPPYPSPTGGTSALRAWAPCVEGGRRAWQANREEEALQARHGADRPAHARPPPRPRGLQPVLGAWPYGHCCARAGGR